MPYVRFYALWCVLLPLWCKNRNLGFLRLWSIVPIRTVLGTMAVLVGSIVAVAELRNFAGVVIGTGCVWLTFYGWLRMISVSVRRNWKKPFRRMSVLGRVAEKSNLIFYICTSDGEIH